MDRIRAAIVAVALLRRSLRDPDSLKLDDVFTRDAPRSVCIEFRARNGFGAVDRSAAVVTPSGVSFAPNNWNRECVGAAFYSVDTWGL
jgi:hypothetical protein